jgi:hypothetical protein
MIPKEWLQSIEDAVKSRFSLAGFPLVSVTSNNKAVKMQFTDDNGTVVAVAVEPEVCARYYYNSLVRDGIIDTNMVDYEAFLNLNKQGVPVTSMNLATTV